jgi:hypothetical protein
MRTLFTAEQAHALLDSTGSFVYRASMVSLLVGGGVIAAGCDTEEGHAVKPVSPPSGSVLVAADRAADPDAGVSMGQGVQVEIETVSETTGAQAQTTPADAKK